MTDARTITIGTITIRRPTAAQPEREHAPAFTVDGPLEGARVGLRTDMAWRSWQLIAGDWAKRFHHEGATTLSLETQAQIGDGGTQDRANVAAWSDDVDFGIVGLGTCGSCTSFSVHDAVTLEAHGKPSLVVVCSEFEQHARNMASFLGHGNLKVLVMPYPLEARPDEELHQIADEYYPQALTLLGVSALGVRESGVQA
jgi:hypothetical protein